MNCLAYSRFSILLAASTCMTASGAAMQVSNPSSSAVVLELEAMSTADASVASIWNDPSFQKSFIGGYGIDADIEPRMTRQEVAFLEKIRPLMESDLPQAEERLIKVITPECSATLDFTLGGIRFQQDRFVEAMENYQTAVKKFPSFRRAWRNIGLISVRNGDNPAAIKAFTRMIELGGADAYSYGLLAFCHAGKQDFQPAEAAYRNALLLQPDNLEWRLGLTRCVFRQNKFEDAASLLDVLITENPNNGDFWMLQAHTFLGLKQPLKAAHNLEAMDVLGKSSVDTLFTLGDIYLTENLLVPAQNAYQRGVERDAAQPCARAIRSAELLSTRGGVVQARALLAVVKDQLSLTMSEVDRRRVLKLDARLSMANGAASEDSVRVLEEIVKLDPLDGEALMLLGQQAVQAREPDRALLYFERAASIESLEATARLRAAQTLVSMGRFQDAIPLLRRVQEIKPREDIARYLEQVERIARSQR